MAWLLGLAAVFHFGHAANTPVPAVRMLVPGFTVRELPIRLSNQNNLRFAPDGSLTSLGYDGKVWCLRDTNGDGLEDQAEPFWDQPTLSVPVGMAWTTHGLYVSSKGKVSRLRDTNGDGRADQEQVIASGWPATDVGSRGVDATAVTLDAEGNVYFGLLVADYSNAYRLRQRASLQPEEIAWLKWKGRWYESRGTDPTQDTFSLYDLESPRGTIQKFDPRTGRRTTFATGLRVPVALAFNREGDLFNTDQEGETWLPNGNPLDELNHIVDGRNYGFPPRHELWLPDLLSEPPVVSFGPQHQSTCGLVFNEPRTALDPPASGGVPLPAGPAQGLFGPSWWSGDAFVAGESRGKIWRVRLVKTPHGYVGKSFPIAQLSVLTVDLAISPQGNLYVASHSGEPDWGTGPQGEGRIFQISYTDTNAPQPVIAWAASSTEVRVSFDRPLASTVLSDDQRPREPSGSDESATERRPQRNSSIEFGEYVRAGSHGETLKPPYEVVQQQDAAPSGQLRIQARRLEDSNRTLVLTTDPHALAVTYALTLSGIGLESRNGPLYVAEIEYDLSGCLARNFDRKAADPRTVYSQIWYPHPDGKVTQQLVRNSFAHSLFERRRDGRRFFLETRAILPEGNTQFAWRIPGWDSGSSDLTWEVKVLDADGPGRNAQVELTVEARAWFDGWTQPGLAALNPPRTNVFTPPLSWFRPAWAPSARSSSGTDSRPAPKPDGDWETGRDLFVNRQLCAKCHRLRGEGGLAGPDLSNLIHRDPASVRRDIVDPDATLHPDYVTYQAELTNGDLVVGFLRSQGINTVHLFDAAGRETTVNRADLKNLHPTGHSLMPTGLLDGLKHTEVRDLLTFLLHEPPRRSRADLESVRTTGSTAPQAPKALRLVLVASQQDHGPGQHDYPAWQEKWLRLMRLAASNAVVEKAWEWPSIDQFREADVLVFYYWNHDWSATRLAELDAYQQRGGGLVLLHSAVIADQEPERLAQRIGLAAQPGRTGYRHMPFELKFEQREHPLLRGLPERLSFLDEPYWPLVGDPAGVEILASAQVDGTSVPLIWTCERGSGRVFGSIPGHYFWTLDDPWFRLLVFRAVGWAGRASAEQLTSTALEDALWK